MENLGSGEDPLACGVVKGNIMVRFEDVHSGVTFQSLTWDIIIDLTFSD